MRAGALLPTGSRETKQSDLHFPKNQRLYLKDGTGNPCAGQNNVMSCLDCLSYQANFASFENFGAFVATGSIRLK
jgi:hypothetical protein